MPASGCLWEILCSCDPRPFPVEPQRHRKQTEDRREHAKDAKRKSRPRGLDPCAYEICPREGNNSTDDGGHNEAISAHDIV